MIPNHPRFIEAIHSRKKVSVRFYSEADSGPLDRVCAPMDYGPGGEIKDGLNRYWFWDYARTGGSHSLGLVPQQIIDLQVLGEEFDPVELNVRPPQWSIAREWSSPQPTQNPDPTPLVAEFRRQGQAGQPILKPV
ncbi:MAG: hypothetical protein H7X97_09730 [Opitutaceae bacterium]|nr:hypothetical protein [Verrucomicrobiales bacterium]